VDELMGQPLQGTSGLIEVTCEADGHVLTFIGDVDAPVVKALQRECDFAALNVVAVDVGGLTFIDSTGLSVLVEWSLKAKEAGRVLVIRRVTGRFERVLALAGLTNLFAYA
jgi:anti-anti-sigma factor